MRYTKKTGYKALLKSRTSVCAIALVALCVIRFTPDDTLTKTKNAVKLIVMHNTDIKSEIIKIKNIFIQEDGLDAMAPVAEFVNPVPGGKISVAFGAQDANHSEFHYGVDIEISPKSNVCAASEGKVTEIARNDEYGSYIIIEHNEKISTVYANLGEIFPDVGESVSAAKPIGRPGEDGLVYFEIRRGEVYLNPEDFINFGE